jgi:hypothetical protein
LLCIFFCYCSVSSPLEESEDENNDVDPPGTKFDDPLTTKDCIIGHGPHPKLSRGEEIYNVEREFKIVNEKKFICSIDLLICMFQARCQTPGCDKSPEVNYHFIGPTVIVNCLCPQGHKFRFCSSHEVNGIYGNNLMAAACIMLSGNNFGKVRRMARFYGLEFLAKSTYHRFQRLYLIPEVNEWWSWMRQEILDEFAGKDIVVGGDGQCDSPGFNAKNLCYFMVENSTNYTIGIEILDKRHVGLISTNMERKAVKQGLDKLKNDNVRVVEFVTDASSSIKALLGL